MRKPNQRHGAQGPHRQAPPVPPAPQSGPIRDANQFGYIIDSNIKRIRLYISFIRKYDEESRPASASAPRTACSAKRADSSGAVSAPPSREAPNPRSSANTAAPRARADSKDSSTNAAPPSPGTKPSRASSKGRDASDGTGFRLSAWALAYPSIPPRERRESPPEQRTVSERPYRTRRKPSPMACSADAHAVPNTRPSPWISRKRANAVFPVLGSQRKSHRASSASESAEGSPFSRSKSSMGPDAPIRQVCGGMCGSNPAEAAARRPDKTANAAPRFR